MPLIHSAQLESRKSLVAAGGPLEPLFVGLAGELEPLLARDLYLPRGKALLTRAGGRCEADGMTLEFDPFSPDRHRCPTCRRVHDGEWHHRAWITSYQLWLAERAVHGAIFAALRGEARHARLARDILLAYADRYSAYPNVDNVLGPSRLFFSTYLESIWLLQVCVATHMLALHGDRDTGGRVREHIIEPARAMIGEFDEGLSNRQVWHNAALMAAAVLCEDRPALEDRVRGRSGLEVHLGSALLEDGSWYEGENYHQFALRGLWYGVVIAEQHGLAPNADLLTRFNRAFLAPFATALPDFTMPSRKDSQYAVSLRQWRLAELAELGFARTGDVVLARSLQRCYEPGHSRRDTGRARSTADVERNTPSGALTRADLSWRALLFAAPELPAVQPTPPRSAHLRAQGYAVFRRDADVYVGFDYGQSGGGHGHPDRLNLTLYQGATRWLDDMGTGSYLDPSLHWYRSTLAHNAPLVDGQSQPLGDGELLAYDEREGMGWVVARFRVPETGITLERAIVVGTDYLIDELSWSMVGIHTLDAPMHLDGEVAVLTLHPAALDGGHGVEDGFDFVRETVAVALEAGSPARIESRRDGRTLSARLECSRPARLFAAVAPGQPATTTRRFHLVRAAVTPDGTEGHAGILRTVISWNPLLVTDTTGNTIVAQYPDGERHLHRRDGLAWHVDLHAGGATSSIDLAGAQPAAAFVGRSDDAPALTTVKRGGALRFHLGRDHYRRSEQDWAAAGQPSADVTVRAAEQSLSIAVDVRAGEAVFPVDGATNPYDNEHPDTMGAGLQLYLRCADRRAGWSLVPEGQSNVRVRPIGGHASLEPPAATWTRLGGEGYRVEINLPLPADAFAGRAFDLDLIVNETLRGRTRRRGQLVLTGAAGEWVYLRGDRHDDTRWIRIAIQ